MAAFWPTLAPYSQGATVLPGVSRSFPTCEPALIVAMMGVMAACPRGGKASDPSRTLTSLSGAKAVCARVLLLGAVPSIGLMGTRAPQTLSLTLCHLRLVLKWRTDITE